MALPFFVMCLLTLSGMYGSPHRSNYSRAGLLNTVTICWGTCASVCASDIKSMHLPLFFSSDTADLARLISVMALQDNFTISESCLRSFVLKISSKNESSIQSFKSLKLRCLIVLLLLISGNVQPNPGPDSAICFNTPADFKSRAGLGFIHLNVRSLIAKIDIIRIWAHSTEADVIVLSETWLSKSVLNEDISIDGYNVYRTDRPRRGGGVAVYIKSKFRVNMLLSKSVSKQFEFLALDLEVSRTLHITVVGCYRTPSAVRDALPSLMQLLSGLN